MSTLYPLPPDGDAATEDAGVALRAWMDHARTLNHKAEVLVVRWSNQAVRAERLAAALDFYAGWHGRTAGADHQVIVDGGDRARAALAAYRDEDQCKEPI